MLNIQEIRKELGEYAFEDEDCISGSMRKCIEKYCCKHFKMLPYDHDLDYFKEKDIDKYTLSFIGKGINYKDDNNFTVPNLNFGGNQFDHFTSVKNIINAYPDAVILGSDFESLADVAIFHDDFVYYRGTAYTNSPHVPQKLLDCMEDVEKINTIKWVLRNSRGQLVETSMKISPQGNIAENYNNDFIEVDKKLNQLVREDRSCIMILHGKPGTGKTSYIRNFISNNKDLNFYWIDSSMFNYMDNAEFIEFLSNAHNGIFVLEDSESILISRERNKNSAIQSLLSISDGMLGDSLKLKFICTFNTDMRNIDEAILRKGRMKLKYEFKDLCKEKVEKLFEKLGIDTSLAKDMPLCDVYNFLDDNGNNVKRTSIGF